MPLPRKRPVLNLDELRPAARNKRARSTLEEEEPPILGLTTASTMPLLFENDLDENDPIFQSSRISRTEKTPTSETRAENGASLCSTPSLLETHDTDKAMLKAIMEKIDLDILRYEEKALFASVSRSIEEAGSSECTNPENVAHESKATKEEDSHVKHEHDKVSHAVQKGPQQESEPGASPVRHKNEEISEAIRNNRPPQHESERIKKASQSERRDELPRPRCESEPSIEASQVEHEDESQVARQRPQQESEPSVEAYSPVRHEHGAEPPRRQQESEPSVVEASQAGHGEEQHAAQKGPQHESDNTASRCVNVKNTCNTQEVSRKIRLPKYVGGSKRRLITSNRLRVAVVDRILEKDEKKRRLAVRLDDDSPYSTILHCNGHPHLVKQVEVQVKALIRAIQQREQRKAPIEVDDDSDNDAVDVESPQDLNHDTEGAGTEKNGEPTEAGPSESTLLSARIPRRVSTTKTSTGQSSAKRKSVSRSTSSVLPKKVERRGTAPAQMHPPKTFEVAFRSNERMGCFFVTETMKDGPVCMVASLHNCADSRVHVGAILTDATIGEGKNVLPVRTHNDLKRLYVQARRRRARLRVRFSNMCSLTASMMLREKYGEWTPSGEWRGSDTKGWPGGAPCIALNKPPNATAGSHPRTRQHNSCYQAGGETGKSVQRRPSTKSPASKKSLTDSPSRLEQTRKQVDLATAQGAGHQKPAARVPGFSDLMEAVQHKGIGDMIALLQAGACSSIKDEKTAKQWLKSRLESLQSEIKSNPPRQDLVLMVNEFKLKRRLLSIYSEALAIIESTWGCFQYRIDRLHARLSVDGEDHGGSQVLDCRLSVNDEERKSVPLISTEKGLQGWKNFRTDYDNDFHYNTSLSSRLSQENQQLTVSLYKGDKTEDSVEPILLGKAVIPFSRIVSAVGNGGALIEEKFRANKYLLKGNISIKANRVEHFPGTKSHPRHLVTRLEELIRWIILFNEETETNGMKLPRLTAHIVSPSHGISLLHAALTFSDPDLVLKLVTLGAHPEAESKVGSAVRIGSQAFGHSQEERTVKVLRNLSKSARNTTVEGKNGSAETMGVTQSVKRELSVGKEATSNGRDVVAVGRARATERENTASVPSTSATKTANETPSSGKPRPERQKECLNTRRDSSSVNNQSHTATMRPGDLPLLDYWFTKNERRCRYFNRKRGCRDGPRCRDLHIQPPIGQLLDKHPRPDGRGLRRDCVTVKRVQSPSGRWFYAAAYTDPKDKIVYEAERGPTVGQNQQGVYWYRTEQDAIVALERVVKLSCQEARTGDVRMKREILFNSPNSIL